MRGGVKQHNGESSNMQKWCFSCASRVGLALPASPFWMEERKPVSGLAAPVVVEAAGESAGSSPDAGGAGARVRAARPSPAAGEPATPSPVALGASASACAHVAASELPSTVLDTRVAVDVASWRLEKGCCPITVSSI